MELIQTLPQRVGTPGRFDSILAEQKQMGRRKLRKIIPQSQSSIQNQIMSGAIQYLRINTQYRHYIL